jgi:hypothetical protein
MPIEIILQKLIKKSSFFLFLFLFLIEYAFATDINVLSFGAIPNDLKNDSKAFIAAANFINKTKGNVTLIIPEGKYIVGMQEEKNNQTIPCHNCASNSTLIGVDIISLINCKNVTIVGVGKVEIIYESKLKLGGFEIKKGLIEKAIFDEKTKQDYSKMHSLAAAIGSFILIKNCSSITVKNIKTNGNAQNLLLGANIGIGLNPYEIMHCGVTVVNSEKINIVQSQFNNYGMDGMYISNDSTFTKKFFNNEIKITNCNFNENGRQGLSIVGAIGFEIKNCTFNKTGIGRIKTAPSCGVDIEPTVGVCKKGIFNDCEFIDNSGFSVGINDYISGSEDFLFFNCLFIAPYYYTIGTSMPKVKFEKCNFYGETIFSFNAINKNDATSYSKCNFFDTYKYKPMYSFGGALMFIKLRGSFLNVEQCKFSSINNLSFFIDREKYKDSLTNTLFYNNQITCKLKVHRFNLSYVSYGITFQKNIFSSSLKLPFQKGNFNIFKDNIFKTINN